MVSQNIIYYEIIPKSKVTQIPEEILLLDKKLETKQSLTLLYTILNQLGMSPGNIEFGIHGKPYFKEKSIFFSYSHSKDYLACAIGMGEVGIDIEESHRIISDTLARKVLERVSDPKERIRRWVLKEAYAKMKGLGIQIGMKEFFIKDIVASILEIEEPDWLSAICTEIENPIFKKIDYKE